MADEGRQTADGRRRVDNKGTNKETSDGETNGRAENGRVARSCQFDKSAALFRLFMVIAGFSSDLYLVSR